MPKIKYIQKRFSSSRLEVIRKANEIIEEYTRQGYELTLRQLYYQFVSRDYIKNNLREYKNLGDAINDGRLAGLIDWDSISDRTRNLKGINHWNHPSEILEAVAEQFAIDKWKDQEAHVEVWVEKDALIGVIERVANRYDVSYFSCRGYTSQSELWAAGMRLKNKIDEGKTPIVLHLGDHDPSGIDMTRDIADRLKLFCGERIEVKRLALNRDQVDQYDPPPNFAKITDSRANAYISEHGDKSWELDALEPSVIEEIIGEVILKYRSQYVWDDSFAVEARHKEKLALVAKHWEKLTKKL